MSDFPLPLNPAALQSALTQMPQPATPAGGVPTVQPPDTGPSQATQQAAQVNLGSSDQPKQGNAIPKPDLTPNLVRLFQGMFGDQAARGYTGGTGSPGTMGSQPARPVSRLDAFEEFLGNFLYSFSQGMEKGGTGPGANARGFGIATQAPYQQQLQQYQLGQQQQAQQAQVGLQQAETERTQAQSRMVPVQPYGPQGPTIYMSADQAKGIYQAQVTSQGRVQAAGLKRYAQGPFGVLDTQTGQLVSGTGGGIGATVTVTPDLAKQYDIPQQYVGKQIKNSDLVGFMNAKSRSETIAQGSQGPSLVDKGLAAATGGREGITPLGIGSPAANPLAQAKFQISSAEAARGVQMNQGQVDTAMQRLRYIRDNSSVLTNMLDAGKIELSMGGDGIIRAAIGRNAQLTPQEAKFAADFQSMSEDIGLLRLPQGGGGFRSEEAFEAMQAQRGRLYQNQQVFKNVIDNTLQSYQAIRDTNQDALDRFYAANPRLRPSSGPTARPTPKANDPLGVL